LSPKEQIELLAWLLERDQKSGKLDSLIAEAKSDRTAGKAHEL
jgi:hypothetical protein